MTVKQAKDLLTTVTPDSSPCKVNPVMMRADFHKIMMDCMNSQQEKHGADWVIGDLFEKRIHQCVKNQRRPRY